MVERVKSARSSASRVRSTASVAAPEVPSECMSNKMVLRAYEAHMRAMGIAEHACADWLAAARKDMGTDKEIPMISALRAVIAVSHGFPQDLICEGFPEARRRRR